MSRDDITLYTRTDSPYWWIAYYDEDGKRKYRSCRQWGLLTEKYTRSQAQRAIEDILGIHAPASDLSTLDSLKQYIIPRLEREGLKLSTIRDYRTALDHLMDLLGPDFPVDEFDRRHITEYQEFLVNRNVRAIRDTMNTLGHTIKPSTANKYVRNIQSIFNRLYYDGYLDRSPFRKYRKLRTPDMQQLRALTRDEAHRFLAALDESPHQDRARIARILLETGRRLNEILEIPRADIDLASSRILATNNKSRDNKKEWVMLSPQTCNDIAYFLATEAPDPEYPLRRWHSDTIGHWIKKVLVDVGLPELNCHSLRHSFATIAGESGVDLWKIKKQLGHSSIQVTEKYFHAEPTDSIDLRLRNGHGGITPDNGDNDAQE